MADSIQLLHQRLDCLQRDIGQLNTALLVQSHWREGVWQLLGISLFHGLVSLSLLGLSNSNSEIAGVLMYATTSGSLITLAIWHGMTLRPLFDRWWRSVVAAASVMWILTWSEDIEFSDLWEGFMVTCVGPAGVAACTAFIVRHACACGLEAPELRITGRETTQPRRLSLTHLAYVITAMAALFTLMLWYGDSQNLLNAIAGFIYGGVVGLIGTAIWIFVQQTQSRLTRIRVGSMSLIAVFLLNTLFAVVLSWAPTGTPSLMEFLWTGWPYFLLFTLVQPVLPLLTATYLHANGHTLNFAARETTHRPNGELSFDELS